MARTTIVISLDDRHNVVIVEDSRAWVLDTVDGVRVSITWVRQPDETAEDFIARVTRLGHEALSLPPDA